MRKPLFFILALLTGISCILSACGPKKEAESMNETAAIDFEKTICSADEGLALAKAAGWAVSEDGVCTANKAAIEDFYKKAQAGESAVVYCAAYYTLDRERVSEELYNEEKDSYPRLFFSELTFNGAEYKLRVRACGENAPETDTTAPYLMHYDYELPSTALYKYCDRYVLTYSGDVTWQQLEHGILSSNYGDYIPFHMVFSDFYSERERETGNELFDKVCSADEALEAARAAGVPIVIDAGTENRGKMREFYDTVQAGGRASIVCAWYTSLEYVADEDYREDFKDEYPRLDLYLVEYDGTEFTARVRRSDDTGMPETHSFKLLKYFDQSREDGTASHYYVLQNEDTGFAEGFGPEVLSYMSTWTPHLMVFAWDD